MTDKYEREYSVRIKADQPVYVIGVVSELVHIPIWTLRKLDDMEVVVAHRIGKNTRCYSQQQIAKLNYIKYLMEERGVNISAVKVVLEMRE